MVAFLSFVFGVREGREDINYKLTFEEGRKEGGWN